MFFRILKKDLKRKKTMNVIIIMFLILATMFMASGINNVISVMSGTDEYLNMAGVGDFVIISMDDATSVKLKETLDKEKSVKSYRTEVVYYGAKGDILYKDGEKCETKNAILYQSIDDSVITFFDKDNNKITEVSEGGVYVTSSFMEDNNINVGDKIVIKYLGSNEEFVVNGEAKDALLGSSMMGNTRVIMNDKDLEKITANKMESQNYKGQICYIDTDDVDSISSAISKMNKIMLARDRNTFKMCYVMDMIIAFIVLILSICLIIVSFIVLRFSIAFSIEEEYREIGVMKAIGIRNLRVRGIYLVKYAFMASVGAIVGFVLSIPFGRMMLGYVSKEMVLGHKDNIIPNIIGAIAVVVVTLLFTYLCTGKMKKMSPITAIRTGKNGERFSKKSKLRLGTGCMSNSVFLAVNDVLSNPKRYLTIITSFCICTLFVLVLNNTVSTMDSDAFISTFGTASDLYMTSEADAMRFMSGSYTKEDFKNHLKKIEGELEGLGMKADVTMEVQYRYKIISKGNSYSITCEQGVDTKCTDYEYTKGICPMAPNEIAVTSQIRDKIHVSIGDTVTIDFGTEKLECVVVAYFETMNQLGEVIRLHEDAPTSFDAISSMMSYQIDFDDEADDKTIETRKEKIKEYYDNEKVYNKAEYCVNCIGVVDTMRTVEIALLCIVIVIVILVTILTERAFISDDKSQIAILKAIGFDSGFAIRWHVIRFAIVSVFATILAAALSIPATNLCITPIFSSMGSKDFSYVIDVPMVFVVFPVIIMVITLITVAITAQYTRKITSSDTSNIE